MFGQPEESMEFYKEKEHRMEIYIRKLIKLSRKMKGVY